MKGFVFEIVADDDVNSCNNSHFLSGHEEQRCLIMIFVENVLCYILCMTSIERTFHRLQFLRHFNGTDHKLNGLQNGQKAFEVVYYHCSSFLKQLTLPIYQS